MLAAWCVIGAGVEVGCGAGGSPTVAPRAHGDGQAGGSVVGQAVGLDRSDAPLVKATAAELTRFAEGDGLFEAVYRAPDGLGPVYIRSSCEACHAADGRGPGLVTKMVAATGQPALLPFGHTQRPYVAGGGKLGVLAPAGVRLTHRLPPAVWGRGYLEAVDDAEIERVAAAADARPGLIKGRIHRVPCASDEAGVPGPSSHGRGHRAGARGLIGRFGAKARIATLDEFAADALLSDMGLTSPLRPRELPNPDGLADDARRGVDVSWEVVQALSDYVRLIEIPRAPVAEGGPGRALFDRALCARCHVPGLRTSADYPVAALAGIEAPVFTDFLLHDMGAALADGLVEGDAGPREWRTAPLMGLRFTPAYLHDGRASSIDEAILAHEGPGSEGNEAVAAFRSLGETERDALVAFVRAL